MTNIKHIYRKIVKNQQQCKKRLARSKRYEQRLRLEGRVAAYSIAAQMIRRRAEWVA